MLRTIVRRASTSSKVHGVSGTYASSLFNIALKRSQLPSVAERLAKLESIVTKPAISATLKNPTLSHGERSAVVKTLQEQVGPDETVGNFLQLLVENNRLGLFSAIYEDFVTLSNEHSGVVTASVTSAKPLDAKSLRRIETVLRNSKFVSGKTGGTQNQLQLESIVNPDIKGGVIVEIDDKTIDLSIASKIQKLNKLLEEDI
ncbi:F1F0 ATP synthase subunit 5 KNAG_0M01610 [Huiozyma naganishii CBS 8797]|uniref:ATP synthase subunit 5, mitochondrial n=1 Tax=Huiozyma naganishii (strain ATCC MYA-139 / BCRC 22969 / CBS 8797 / KCTC 17520 / NBRC 10181 / NCYC 3082 / Yp74L-3) TaxID=1071383 RepID=J7SAT4_HUIN7|nr:hypothetical protein KNAG_0M01610 [Kazachstania naganishii CBS 8797]CCK73014.1 hypothetical protein KNAG_0M01610 [Kazachstania naganishii CBS 8797]